MSTLIDTCIWSIAFRKKQASETSTQAAELKKLLYLGQALLPGVVRLEILSGISDAREFDRIRTELRKLPDFPIETEDYETAAQIFNTCRSKGIQGSHADFLLCALSQRHDIPIFTTDKDFTHFSKFIKIHLHVPIP